MGRRSSFTLESPTELYEHSHRARHTLHHQTERSGDGRSTRTSVEVCNDRCLQTGPDQSASRLRRHTSAVGHCKPKAGRYVGRTPDGVVTNTPSSQESSMNHPRKRKKKGVRVQSQMRTSRHSSSLKHAWVEDQASRSSLLRNFTNTRTVLVILCTTKRNDQETGGPHGLQLKCATTAAYRLVQTRAPVGFADTPRRWATVSRRRGVTWVERPTGL